MTTRKSWPIPCRSCKVLLYSRAEFGDPQRGLVNLMWHQDILVREISSKLTFARTVHGYPRPMPLQNHLLSAIRLMDDDEQELAFSWSKDIADTTTQSNRQHFSSAF